MEENDLVLLRQIERNANAAAELNREVIDSGPFRAMLDRMTDMVWLNYAVPVRPLGTPEDCADALRDLAEVFAQHDRTPRFEFMGELWPHLAPALEAAGYELQVAHPLMACTPESFNGVQIPGIETQILTADHSDAALASFLTVQSEGFSEGVDVNEPDSDEVARLRERIAGGAARSAMALLEGIPAGVGTIVSLEGIGELGAVATRPAMRRRGVALTVSSVLVQDHFDRGGHLAWLSAADHAAQAVYTRIGFVPAGKRLNYIAGTSRVSRS